MELIKDENVKKYLWAAIAVFVLIAGYFAVDAGLIDLVKSVFGVFVGSAPVVSL